jgi:hypothetical protein
MGGFRMTISAGTAEAKCPDSGALAIERGVNRFLVSLALAPLSELALPDGRRADIFAVAADGTITIIEIKSSVADFRSDSKWPDYRANCDRLYFGVDAAFPIEILPEDVGIIRADRYGGALLRDAPVHPLSAARRKSLLLRFARVGAVRLLRVRDPDAAIPETT